MLKIPSNPFQTHHNTRTQAGNEPHAGIKSRNCGNEFIELIHQGEVCICTPVTFSVLRAINPQVYRDYVFGSPACHTNRAIEEL